MVMIDLMYYRNRGEASVFLVHEWFLPGFRKNQDMLRESYASLFCFVLCYYGAECSLDRPFSIKPKIFIVSLFAKKSS